MAEGELGFDMNVILILVGGLSFCVSAGDLLKQLFAAFQHFLYFFARLFVFHEGVKITFVVFL